MSAYLDALCSSQTKEGTNLAFKYKFLQEVKYYYSGGLVYYIKMNSHIFYSNCTIFNKIISKHII